jgi:hypothetical protein
VGLLAFDRARVDTLRVALGAAHDDLRGIRSDDAAAADVMSALSAARRTLNDVWLPRVHDVLNSTSMTSCHRSAIGAADISQASLYAATHDRGWEIMNDPLPVYGPPAPDVRSFDEVLADVRSGVLMPMVAPLDADGRAGAHYTSLTFAAAHPVELDTKEVTSNVLKVVDFFSDGLPIGWREEQTLTIYRLTNARITSSVHVLTAYERDQGPETLRDLTTEATVSGYMIIASRSTKGEVSVRIGTGDDTQSQPIVSQSISSFEGMFYPDALPDFQPMSQEARYVSPDRWTFTKSASPMVEGWGTWGS